MSRTSRSLVAAALGIVASGAVARGQLAQPTFHVDYEGPRGTNTLRSIDFGNGLQFTKFIYATNVTEFVGDDKPGNYGQTRIVRGPDSNVGPEPMKAPLTSHSEADHLAFEQQLTGVFQNTNLNSFLDNHGATPYFSFVLELESPIRDNKPNKADNVGEIIFFERGANVANSYILLEALDAEGNVLGTPYLLNPNVPIEMNPPVQACVLRSNDFSYHFSQDLGGVSIDLDELGVRAASRIRVSRPTVGENGLTSSMLSGGRDLNPDFKLVFVQTYNVRVPAWVVGD